MLNLGYFHSTLDKYSLLKFGQMEPCYLEILKVISGKYTDIL